MRTVLIAILALLLASPALARDPAPKPLADRCDTGAGVTEYRARNGMLGQHLGAMPPAAQILAVYRVVDGCAEPVVLREGIGANPDRKLPIVRGRAQGRTLDR